AGHPQRHQDQPARHARLRRLHGGPKGRAPRGRLSVVRRLRHRRDRRRDQDAVGGVRRGRHAARGRDHQDRPPAGRVPGDAGRVPRGLRRRRGAAVPAGRRARHRADRAAVAEAVQLLRRRALRGRARGRRRGAHDRPARRADRGVITESEDESLMDRYLSGEEIDPKVLIEDLEKAVARGSFYPVLVASAPQKIGMLELLEVMTEAFPSPAEHPLPSVTTPDGKPVTGLSSDPKGPLLAEVVKTTSDSYVGRISLVRVFSGTLRPDASVHVSGHGRAASGHEDHDDDERIGALTSPLGKLQRPVTQCAAGDICAVAKLSTAETGDTLSDKDNPLLMESWSMPEPLLPVAIVAKSKADEDKLSQALSRLVAEDPTLRLENNAETRQLVLWCMGEAHADVLLDRLGNRYGVAVETTDLRVPLRETIASKAQGLGRNVKQS